MEAAKRALAPARDQLRDTDADGLPEIAHTIERFDRNCDFGHAAGVVAGFQDISDHALVTTDCLFDLRAHVIPCLPHDPKFPGVYDAEIVGDGASKFAPSLGYVLAWEAERRLGEVLVGCVAPVVRYVLVHH